MLESIQSISTDFKWYYDKGFITVKDGNACVKLDNRFVVTASGVDKHNLQFSDFITIYDNEVTSKASIETKAHLVVLNSKGTKASVHVHSPKTVALFKVFKGKETQLEHKLNNEWPELFRYTSVGNTVDFLPPGSKELHDAIEDSVTESNGDIIVLQQHGVLATAESIDECRNHIVRLEHVCAILLDIAKVDKHLI